MKGISFPAISFRSHCQSEKHHLPILLFHFTQKSLHHCISVNELLKTGLKRNCQNLFRMGRRMALLTFTLKKQTNEKEKQVCDLVFIREIWCNECPALGQFWKNLHAANLQVSMLHIGFPLDLEQRIVLQHRYIMQDHALPGVEKWSHVVNQVRIRC